MNFRAIPGGRRIATEPRDAWAVNETVTNYLVRTVARDNGRGSPRKNL